MADAALYTRADRLFRTKRRLAFGLPLLILAYLVYVFFAFDIPGLAERARLDNARTLVADTYEYNVPAGYAYIRYMVVADSEGDYPDMNKIPNFAWRLALDDTDDPEIIFSKDIFDLLIAGRTVKIVGQKRPSQLITDDDSIVAGMESFVRERAIAYAGEALAATTDALAQPRLQAAQQAWARSEAMLARHPQEFRVKPSSVLVPGR